MSNSITSEIHSWYEDTVREALPAIFWKFLRIPICEPIDGFNRKYIESHREYEVDFSAHSVHGSIPYLIGATDIDFKLVKVWVSKASTSASSPICPSVGISPEKASPTHLSTTSNCYVIAEITYGGDNKSIKSKVAQLENVCNHLTNKFLISSAMFINAIAIVSPSDEFQNVFNYINSSALLFPHVFNLFKAGRFIYIQNACTLVKVVFALDHEVKEFRSEVEEFRTEVEEFRSEVEEFRTEVEEFRTEVEDQLKEMNGALGVLTQWSKPSL
jgi:hypothetical protein